MKKYFQKIPKVIWILTAIVLLGVLLRAYHFHDLLRFNADQSRDAGIVRDVMSGKVALPLLGPKAGGTEFKLGPAFYYFELASAKIFGNSPDKMAYPDLLASILTIPLLYLFLRKYFSQNITLISAALLAVSYFAVGYSRFAWNPNSAPFYVLLFLYSLHELTNPAQKRKLIWAIVLGIAVGIGIQLHSLLLFTFPIVLVIYFFFLIFKGKKRFLKYAAPIILVVLLVNITQIQNELKTNGENIKAFFKGAQNKSSRSGNVLEKLSLDAVCHVQGNAFILLPLGSNDQCDFMNFSKNFYKNLSKDKPYDNMILAGTILFAIIFSLGGYALLVKSRQREKNESKKRFLEIIILYVAVLFLILIPLADEISLRFFLILEFVPFLFLAFWLTFLREKFFQKGIAAGILIASVLFFTNLYFLRNEFEYLSGRYKQGSGGFQEITLGEVEYIASFILQNSSGAKNIYVEGKAKELFKSFKSIEYFTKPAGLDLKEYRTSTQLLTGDKVFQIDIIKNPAAGKKFTAKETNPYILADSGRYARIRIYELETK